jgi:hypothetical protein
MKVEYPAPNTTSVWVGTFPSENDFDHCVDKDVTPILGLGTPIESICEISFEKQSVSIAELVQGFSGWETFIDEVNAAAKSQGIEKANSALVCYYVKCIEAPIKWGRLAFLGSFSGRDIK